MTDGTRWIDAVALDELWEGDILDVEVASEPVLLAHLDGGVIKAYQGMCPHQEVLLADGDWDSDANVLTCSGHLWEFDLTTGKGLNPSGCQLYEFAVQVADGTVRVGIPDDGRRHHNRYAT